MDVALALVTALPHATMDDHARPVGHSGSLALPLTPPDLVSSHVTDGRQYYAIACSTGKKIATVYRRVVVVGCRSVMADDDRSLLLLELIKRRRRLLSLPDGTHS